MQYFCGFKEPVFVLRAKIYSYALGVMNFLRKLCKKLVFPEVFDMYVKLYGYKSAGVKSGSKYYIDVGLHVSGAELGLASQWLKECSVNFVGIEANPKHFAAAQKVLADTGAVLLNFALVGPDHCSEKVALYVDSTGSGVGDSLLGERAIQRSLTAVDVEAVRLSELLHGLKINPCEDTIAIRMNIEGSELFVLQDLERAGMLGHIDAFLGSWDDAGKISKSLEDKQLKIMKKYSIYPIQFNARDIRGAFAGLKRKILEKYLRKVFRCNYF